MNRLISDTMSGVVLMGHGGPEMLQWRDDLRPPRPGPGDVLTRITAAAVNNTDVLYSTTNWPAMALLNNHP